MIHLSIGVESEDTPVSVGPWDCDTGIPLSPEECCDMIKTSVPHADVKGNFLDCHVSPPLGSDSNPHDPNRVVVLTNENHIVIREPMTG